MGKTKTSTFTKMMNASDVEPSHS